MTRLYDLLESAYTYLSTYRSLTNLQSHSGPLSLSLNKLTCVTATWQRYLALGPQAESRVLLLICLKDR